MNSCGFDIHAFYSDRDIKEIKITTGIPLQRNNLNLFQKTMDRRIM